MGIYDVPAGMLIDEVAVELKGKLKQPEFIIYVKSGAHRERVPQNPDWFYVRAASILYRIYKNGNLGTGALRNYYGGRKNRGVKPEAKRKASGKVIRTCLQELEKNGFIKKDKKGRLITGKGEKLLYTKSIEVGKVFKEETDKKENKKTEIIEKSKQRIEKFAKEQKAKSDAAEPKGEVKESAEVTQKNNENFKKKEHVKEAKKEEKHGKQGEAGKA